MDIYKYQYKLSCVLESKKNIEFEYYKRIKTKTTKKRWFYSTSIFVILFIVEKQNSLLYCVF